MSCSGWSERNPRHCRLNTTMPTAADPAMLPQHARGRAVGLPRPMPWRLTPLPAAVAASTDRLGVNVYTLVGVRAVNVDSAALLLGVNVSTRHPCQQAPKWRTTSERSGLSVLIGLIVIVLAILRGCG